MPGRMGGEFLERVLLVARAQGRDDGVLTQKIQDRHENKTPRRRNPSIGPALVCEAPGPVTARPSGKQPP
ncbi:hypothetical protein JCM2811A_25360 [Methylorubrum rhodinum]